VIGRSGEEKATFASDGIVFKWLYEYPDNTSDSYEPIGYADID